jgi:eukaryotic-like serine/threonine-protein kinase
VLTFKVIYFLGDIPLADLIGTVLDGKYEIKGLLGEGGMGAVYEATHRLIGRRLAVKFLHSQYATNEEVLIRFQREAQAAAAIGHENIIEVTDMGTYENSPYIVLEYLDGLDVRQLLVQETALPPERAAHIMIQALSALQAAHEAGIIHRDLKPENIYLIEKPERPDYVKLLDFGISKFRSLEGDGAKGLTQTGTVLGTPYYMSPEQARGDQDLSSRSDIYAMGVILFQMLTGQLPFDAPNYNALLIKILTEDPPDPNELNPEIPDDLVETIKIAMDRDAANRFADCIEFRQRLLSYAPGSSAVRFQTGLSPASRTAVRAAMDTNTMTPLEMTRSGGIAGARSKLPFILGGVAAAAIALFVTVVVLVAGGGESRPQVPAVVPVAQPVEPTIKETPPVKEAEPKTIKLRVSAVPPEATVAIDGVVQKGNPFKGEFKKDGKSHKIEVMAAGFEAYTQDAVFDSDQSFSYRLTKTVVKPEKSSAGSSRRKKKSGREVRITPKSTPKSASGSATKPKKKPRRKIDDEDPWG